MADPSNASRDLGWYQTQWKELMDLLPTSEPEEVVEQVRQLQIGALDEQAEALEEMGVAEAPNAKTVLQRIFERLQRLRQENQVLEDLQKAVGADSPDEVVASIDELRERVRTLEERQQVLTDAGFEHPKHALQAVTSMKQQLDELYGEKEAAERSIPDTDFDGNGDTFDQLQALLAREEKLQRELGVASPDAVVEIVEGLTDQLEDLYQDRDAEASAESMSMPTPEGSSQGKKFEEELGTSDPDAILEMIEGLTDQLDALYEARGRLAELNLSGAEEAIRMVQSMQQQLDALYQKQEQMSDHGIDGIDHALSMIENMEAQLSAFYENSDRLVEEDVEIPGEVVSRLGALEEKVDALIEEKEALRDKRDRLQSQFDELEEQIGTGDPDRVTNILDNLEDQLDAVSGQTTDPDEHSSLSTDEPLASEETLTELEQLDDAALNTLSAGVFCLDDQGSIRQTNENVLQWPSVDTNDPDDLIEKNFFEDVAPGTKNALFQGRFDEGVAEGTMDERFFYTYVGWDASTNLKIHLYRDLDDTHNWIMFRVL